MNYAKWSTFRRLFIVRSLPFVCLRPIFRILWVFGLDGCQLFFKLSDFLLKFNQFLLFVSSTTGLSAVNFVTWSIFVDGVSLRRVYTSWQNGFLFFFNFLICFSSDCNSFAFLIIVDINFQNNLLNVSVSFIFSCTLLVPELGNLIIFRSL